MTAAPEDDEKDSQDAEALTVVLAGVLGGLGGVGLGAAAWLALATQPAFRNLHGYGWVALGGALALTIGGFFARTAKRSFERRRALTARLGELMEELSGTLDSQRDPAFAATRERIEAVIANVKDERTRAFLEAHFNKKRTS